MMSYKLSFIFMVMQLMRKDREKIMIGKQLIGVFSAMRTIRNEYIF